MMGEKSLGQGGLATLTWPHNRHDRIAFRGFQNVLGTFSGNQSSEGLSPYDEVAI